MSRAIRAGHAFQTALGMCADEMPGPVGPEMKKTFDQQNYGLPLKDALNDLAERINIIDVRVASIRLESHVCISATSIWVNSTPMKRQ